MDYGFKLLGAATIAVFGAGAANASLVDFTDTGAYAFSSAGVNGSADGVSYTLTAGPVGSALVQGDDGPGNVGPLAGANDGIGIDNDEITAGGEVLTLSFGQSVRLTGLYFLDLFRASGVDDMEIAEVSVDGAAPFMFRAMQTMDGIASGFATYEGLDFVGANFAFTASGGNDMIGKGDYALAGVDFAAVPLPASGLLLAGTFLGAGVFRRRTKR